MLCPDSILKLKSTIKLMLIVFYVLNGVGCGVKEIKDTSAEKEKVRIAKKGVSEEDQDLLPSHLENSMSNTRQTRDIGV